MFQHMEKQKRLSPIVAKLFKIFAFLMQNMCVIIESLHFFNHGCANSLKHETFMYIM